MTASQAFALEIDGPQVKLHEVAPASNPTHHNDTRGGCVAHDARPTSKNNILSRRASEEKKQHRRRSIGKDASILFIGPRGNGKSSLAVIAGLILKRRVIDADDHFTTTTGLSKSAFRKKHGRERYREQELESTRNMLAQYDKDCVIACGPCIAAEQCRQFMTEYRKNHPVIYVVRPIEEIEDYLGLQGNGNIQKWMSDVHAIYNGLSNFEFFNLPERYGDSRRCAAQESLEAVLPHRLMRRKKVQALQKTQTALARFLAAALGYDSSPLSDGVFPTLYPDFPERRAYSTALCISVSSLANGSVDLRRIAAGADAVELIVDTESSQCRALVTSGTVARFIAEIRRFLSVPIIYHARSNDSMDGDWALYFDLLYQGLRFAPEYLTVDLNAPEAGICALVLNRGMTVIVGHRHNTSAGDHFWRSHHPLEQYRRALRLGCGLVRISKPCESMTENFSCLTLIEKVNALPDGIPIIAYNTGQLGSLSVAFNPILTPVVHTSEQQHQAEHYLHASSEMTVRQRWNTLFSLHALQALRYYVVGSTVESSLSPAMHNAAFQTLGMPHTYTSREAKLLDELLPIFLDPTFGGASVSLPFKTEVLTLVKKVSRSVEVIGASNTILPIRASSAYQGLPDPRCKAQKHHDGPVTMLYADNTDWMGIYACVSRSISPANSVNPQTSGLVVGAGGMARAAVYCLLYLGVRNICIVNRTVVHARSLANHYDKVYAKFLKHERDDCQPREKSQPCDLRIKVLESVDAPWPENFTQPSIVICAIKAYDRARMDSEPFRMPSQWTKNPTGGVIVELAYHTSETPLMQQLREETHPGWTVIDPVEVLFEQACAQFELFTSSRAPREAMWAACLSDYADKMKCNAYRSV